MKKMLKATQPERILELPRRTSIQVALVVQK